MPNVNINRRILFSNGVILTPSQIFGANYYDDWDFNEPTSLNLTGSLINSVASLTGSGRDFTSSGGARPTLTADATLGKNVAAFDGLASFMDVPTSTALYNFLHNAQGGCVIAVYKANSFSVRILGNRGGFSAGDNAPGFLFPSIGSAQNDNLIIANNQQSLANAAVCQIATSNNTITLGNYNSSIGVFDANNSTLSNRGLIQLNGSIVQNNTASNSLTNTNAGYNLTLGRRVRLNDIYFGGKIARLIIANATPTPTQLTQLQAYLNNYYGTFPIS
jgi:hypothetical protein